MAHILASFTHRDARSKERKHMHGPRLTGLHKHVIHANTNNFARYTHTSIRIPVHRQTHGSCLEGTCTHVIVIPESSMLQKCDRTSVPPDLVLELGGDPGSEPHRTRQYTRVTEECRHCEERHGSEDCHSSKNTLVQLRRNQQNNTVLQSSRIILMMQEYGIAIM